jgi:hypothetical protein
VQYGCEFARKVRAEGKCWGGEFDGIRHFNRNLDKISDSNN